MKQITIAALLGGIVFFVWNGISWMALPWHNASIHQYSQGEAHLQELKGLQLQSGVYHAPGIPPDGDLASVMDKYRAGPVITMLVYNAEGIDPMAPGQFGRAFLLNVLAAFLAAFVLAQVAPGQPSFGRRVLIVVAMGAFAGVVGPLSEMGWWHLPAAFALPTFFDLIIGWGLAGAAMATRLKPETAGA